MDNHETQVEEDILQALPGMWNKNPEGLNIRMVQENMGLDYYKCHAAIQNLSRTNRIKIIRQPYNPTPLIVPIDWEEPKYKISESLIRN